MTQLVGVLALALFVGGCAGQLETVDRTSTGPTALDQFIARSYAVNGRSPNFDERRIWEDQIEARIGKYLREHPEMQQALRYSDFRFWRQVAIGSTRGEVRLLLEGPQEQTTDPARLGVLAERHWPAIQGKVKEAWAYPLGWVLFFDDQVVVEMLRKVSRATPQD